MKHQQVSVDYWAMGKTMVTYGALTALVWLMLRLFTAVFTLPRRLRAQQESCEATLKELQKRFPDLNITEEDLREAEKEYEEITKGNNIFDSENRPKEMEDEEDDAATAGKPEEEKEENKKTL